MIRYSLIFAALLFTGAAGCDDGGGGGGTETDAMPPIDAGPPDAPPTPFTECRGSEESFVRQAELALIGRRPLSQGETNVYAEIMRGVAAKDGEDGDPLHARRVVARALMDNPEFVDRWQRHFNDDLRVQRIDDQEMTSCFAKPRRPDDDGTLARTMIGQDARSGSAGFGDFNMYDVIRSSVKADDVTPIYRGYLFALLSRPIPAANVPEREAELARREDFGNTFDAVYLNRDIVCLGCHNSLTSTTDSEDPALDRHWPLPGLFEQAIYGNHTGIDPRKAHAMFRFEGVVDFFGGGGDAPWNWGQECGSFDASPSPDTLTGVTAQFATLTGTNKTVYDTEAMLYRGFNKLRADGFEPGEGGVIADPEVAFAYLVAVSIVDGVWQEVTGNSLVVANYFPRNEASRDVLQLLTEKFIEADFSLRALLEEIVVSPYFDRLPPSAGCGSGPYNMPAVYDPWVISDSDEARRKNGPGDGVAPLSTRNAYVAAYAALGWKVPRFFDFPYPTDFGGFDDPTEDERAFQRATGFFLKNAERGFRGLDFQARLEWENRFGQCLPPEVDGEPENRPDYIDGLLGRVGPTTTYREVIVALKDRLVADGAIRGEAEVAALEAILGATLDSPAVTAGLDGKIRRICGALISSPQFLLSGLAPQDAPTVPALTPAEDGFDAVCAEVAARPLVENLTVTCTPGGLTVD